MSVVKDEAIRLIRSLPGNCSLEDIQYHLSMIREAAEGLADIDEGRAVSQEVAVRRVTGWVASTGRDRLSTT